MDRFLDARVIVANTYAERLKKDPSIEKQLEPLVHLQKDSKSSGTE